jgi:thiamine transporter
LSRLDKQPLHFSARALAYAGICSAMSYALSYIKLWDMPHGGSITLVSLLPLMLYAYIFGAKKGVFVGFTYGVLQALQDPWLIHPAQFLLDYPVAFSAIGLAGLMKNCARLQKLPQVKFTIGACIAGCMRFICHVLSGTLAFEAYAEGQNALVYSLVYNSYVFIDVALVVIAAVFVLSSLSFNKTIGAIKA